MTPTTIGLLLLAAGASHRLGGEPKQLLLYEGESLVRRAARTALASQCRPVVVITGAHRERVGAEVAGWTLEIVFNEQWGMRMASSMRTGMGTSLRTPRLAAWSSCSAISRALTRRSSIS